MGIYTWEKPFSYDVVVNNFICISFASATALVLVKKTHTTLKINKMQNLNQSWLESAKGYNFLPKQLPRRWNIHT